MQIEKHPLLSGCLLDQSGAINTAPLSGPTREAYLFALTASLVEKRQQRDEQHSEGYRQADHRN